MPAECDTSSSTHDGVVSLPDDDAESAEPPGRRPKLCRISYQLETSDCQPESRGWLEKQLARIAKLAGVDGGQIAIVLVDDQRMSELHEQFSGIGGTTDILTFDHRDDPSEPMEADLVICRDVAQREAAQRGHETRLELLLYAVHGLNHLLGGDDHTTAGAKAMHEWEDRMLTAAGFGAVFYRPARKPRATAGSAGTRKTTKKKKATPAGRATKKSQKRPRSNPG